MRELSVRLEAVTPLLLGGANPKGSPELRPPSFRGVMRYWLRAALGGVIGDSNLEGLHKLESAVFGSPDVGSPISIRLRPLNIGRSRAYILPHKNKGRRDGLIGDLELVMTQTRKQDTVIWNAACASLELALTFGGVGLRSRRGYGTLRIVEASEPSIATFPKTFSGWKQHVSRVASSAIQAARALADAQGVPLSVLPVGPAVYPCATQSGLIRLCDVRQRKAIEAVKLFMNQVPKKRALGGIGPRQASPLWVRPIQTGPTTYGLLCVVLASKFSGSDYDFVRRFLDGFDGRYLQVKGWNV